MSTGANLDDAMTALPGVGPRTAARLAARGLRTVTDLLFLMPRAYDDLRRVTPIATLATQPAGVVVLVRGVVKRIRVFPHRLLDVFLEQDGSQVRARWFRPPRGMEKGFIKGTTIALAGPLRRLADDETGVVEIMQPSVHRGEGDLASGLGVRARYPSVPGVRARVVETIVAAAVDRYADLFDDVLDAALRARLALPAVAVALRELHARTPAPSLTDESIAALAGGRSRAHRRLAFEDLLILQVGFSTGRRQARAQAARACAADPTRTLAGVRAALPFALTGAQIRAIDEIARDLAAPRPMQRLLVGDVGSGKTAVAFAAAAIVAASGGQTLVMAPTEVLVEQHLRVLGALSAPLDMRVARLTASMPRAERVETLARCRAGQVQILVGTQAILEQPPATVLPDLRLAIIDEQHRFGVAQRARLRGAEASLASAPPAVGAGTTLPHLLVMSATPIPRTLALTLYGDLDATLLDEMPPGRPATTTKIFVGDDGRAAAYQQLVDAVSEGRQAFVVCPARDRVIRTGAVTAVARHAELRRRLRPSGIRVGLLHGALDSSDQEAVLRAFAAGTIDVLVATTVVEVGLDVPNATVMLVEEADRFGLAQLHQLRGRVGRGAFAGACLLCTAERRIADATADATANATATSTATAEGAGFARLQRLAATSDGFRIAEADLALRGHGDLFGLRQAGTPRLRFADLADYLDLLELARAEALRLEREDPGLTSAAHRPLRDAILTRWSAGAVFAEETG